MAQLRKPGVPVSQNPEYVKRARELNKDLETSILERLHPQGGATETEPLEGTNAVGYRSKDRG